MRYRLRWLAMFCVSASIGFCVLVFRYVQAGATAQLYWHPSPLQALLETAREHAEEYAREGAA